MLTKAKPCKPNVRRWATKRKTEDCHFGEHKHWHCFQQWHKHCFPWDQTDDGQNNSNQQQLMQPCLESKWFAASIDLRNALAVQLFRAKAKFCASVLHATLINANVARPPLTQGNTFFLNHSGILQAVLGFKFMESALKSHPHWKFRRILRSLFESSLTSDSQPPATLPK